MHASREFSTRVLGNVAVVVFACGPLALTAGAASSKQSADGQSPAQVLASALLDAGHQASVREVSHDTEANGSAIGFVTDAGRSAGIQQITYEKGHVTGHLTDVVSGDKAYFRGDSFTLMNFFGFSALPAAHIAGQWISVAKTNKAYAVVAADLTIASVIHDLQVPGIMSTSAKVLLFGKSRVVDGVRQLALVGQQTVSSSTTTVTLYVMMGRLSLPVEEDVAVLKGTQRSSSKIVFGDWNETVRVNAPKLAIPLSSVPTS